jgi:hypothetical protein
MFSCIYQILFVHLHQEIKKVKVMKSIREILEEFAEEVAMASYDTHGEGSEQESLDNIIDRYVSIIEDVQQNKK